MFINVVCLGIMNDVDIPETGAVFTFGQSRFADNIPSHFFIKNDPIIEISCGDQHTAVVCKNGRVFSFGSNEWGQLGLGHKDPVNKPSCVKSLKPEKVKHVACGRVHTVFTTENGKVYSCGCNTDGQLGIGDSEMLDYVALPMFVTELEDEIIQVSAGSQHSALLTAKGTVYVWGSNSDGQLGLVQSDVSIYADPTQLNIPETIVQVNCGYYHTGFVTDSGDLLLCGNCENGKLGINDHDQKEQWIPTKTSIPAKIISVACGSHHTIALTDNGKCYVCGDNTYGQSGLDDVSSTEKWTEVSLLSDLFITHVSAGESHSMFLTDGGMLYACGDTRYGKLCINEAILENSVTKPVQVHFPVPSMKLNTVVCGGCHTMIMASPVTASNKLSPVKEIKAPKIDKDYLLVNKNENNHSTKNDLSPSKKPDQDLTPISNNNANNDHQSEEVRSLSYTTNIDRNSLEDLSGRNSPNVEKTNSMTSDDLDTKNINSPKPTNGVELQNINEIKTEAANVAENKSVSDNTHVHCEGRFKKLLRQFGLQKIVHSKNENNNVPASFTNSQDKKEDNKSNEKKVTSKVCTLL
ncbi:X-linked retinitis pigmentosa GTPase regulator-like [Planococcus citri]|uniref:X-linked retinitis pigmentosa GTPase regulator-like n=1 Tax=Planococcus citri TaxID=170843 RepID=UPI0031F873BC